MPEFKVQSPSFLDYLNNSFIAESKLQLANRNRRNSVGNFFKSRAGCVLMSPFHSLVFGSKEICRGIRAKVSRNSSFNTTMRIQKATLLIFLMPVNLVLAFVKPKFMMQLLNKYHLFEDTPKQGLRELQNLLQSVKSLSLLPFESLEEIKFKGNKILQDLEKLRKNITFLIGKTQLALLEKFIQDSVKMEIRRRNQTNTNIHTETPSTKTSNTSANDNFTDRDFVKKYSNLDLTNINTQRSVVPTRLFSTQTIDKWCNSLILKNLREPLVEDRSFEGHPKLEFTGLKYSLEALNNLAIDPGLQTTILQDLSREFFLLNQTLNAKTLSLSPMPKISPYYHSIYEDPVKYLPTEILLKDIFVFICRTTLPLKRCFKRLEIIIRRQISLFSF